MDGRQDQVVLVAQRRPRLVARSRRAGRASVRSGNARARDRSRRSAPARRGRRRGARYCRSCRSSVARRHATTPRDRRPGQAASVCASPTNAANPSRAFGGRRIGRQRAKASPAAAAATIFSAWPGPTPGRSCNTRKPATRSRGFSTKRSALSASLTCAASRNFRPPNLTNGMLRRVSSSSSAAEWLPVRNSTACDFRLDPASRYASTRSAT